MGAHPVARPHLAHRRAALAVCLLAAAGMLTLAGSAGAQPQPTIGQVQAKLKRLTNKENWLIQRYDAVTQNLASARQRLALVNHEVAKDEAAMRSMRRQIAEIAAVAYENGSMTSAAALLTSSSPQTLLSQAAILTHLSTVNQMQLAQFIATDRQLIGAQRMAKRAETAIAGLKNQLARQKATLEKLIAQQQAILHTLTAAQQRQVTPGGGNGGRGGGGGRPPPPAGSQAQRAVAFALSQRGCPYVFGGTGPCNRGYDCSGLTQAAWAYAGVQIPRTSYGQATLPAVSPSAMQPGDIMLFAGNSHAGIYVGGGMLVDAPMPGMSVQEISIHSSWYASNLDLVVRP